MRPPALILASASPRRSELLASLGLRFRVRPTDVDETPPAGEPPAAVAALLALRKARAVRARSSLVLGSDTIVVLAGSGGPVILGKPVDGPDAITMLRRLSGATHSVFTGVALVSPDGRADVRAVRTDVTFRGLDDGEIDAYVRSGEPMDKAGAYGIQGGAGRFVLRVRGDYSNIIGLPLGCVREMLSPWYWPLPAPAERRLPFPVDPLGDGGITLHPVPPPGREPLRHSALAGSPDTGSGQ